MAGLFFVCAKWEFWSFGELYVTGNGDGGGRGTTEGTGGEEGIKGWGNGSWRERTTAGEGGMRETGDDMDFF